MSIHQEIDFDASPHRVYQVLTNGREFSEATGAPADIHAETGGAISYFGGQITGKIIDLVPDQRIVQSWRVGMWPENIYSTVTFELKPHGSGTQVIMDHTGFPEDNRSHLEPGWHQMYWEPLRKYLAG